MYYNLSKTAEILGMTTGDVNRLREQGKLRAFKDGADWKFKKEDVEKYLTNMIKERSSDQDGGLLSTDDEGEERTLAADSSDFDTMFELAGDGLEISAKEAEPADDGLVLSADDDDDAFTLAPESEDAEADGGLSLVKEESPLTDEDSALAEDPAAVDLASASGSGSGDGLNLSNSDSGLSLLDDVGGSNVDLAGDGADDLVLGGSSGSGSGDGLNLSNSDSGLSLLGDSDAGFELDEAVSDGALSLSKEEDEAPAAEDDGIFELADEASSSSQILNLDQNADADAPTELAADESVFELSTQTTDVPDSSESMSSSVFTTDEPDGDVTSPFTASNDQDEDEDDGGIFGLAEDPTPVQKLDDESKSGSQVISVEDTTEADPFMTDESSDSPFGSFSSDGASASGDGLALDSSDAFGGASESPFGDSAQSGGLNFSKSGEDDGFGSSDGFGGSDSFGVDEPSFGEEQSMPMAAPVSSTQYTGKDLIFLVPCLIFLILATIGALELCRTIWSYQEGSFDLAGPLLETIAKMVKLM